MTIIALCRNITINPCGRLGTIYLSGPALEQGRTGEECIIIFLLDAATTATATDVAPLDNAEASVKDGYKEKASSKQSGRQRPCHDFEDKHLLPCVRFHSG